MQRISAHASSPRCPTTACGEALDRAFPNTVLQAMRQAGSVRSRRGAVEALRRVEQVRESLQSAGLVQSDEPPPALERNLQPGEVAFVRTYADFALQKYEVLDPLLQRVTAFTRFLNARYADKEIRIQRDNGFVVVLDDEAVFEPSALSSGEQQMLVFAYQIIFLAAPHTLVLIDEPELSLHVSWQVPCRRSSRDGLRQWAQLPTGYPFTHTYWSASRQAPLAQWLCEQVRQSRDAAGGGRPRPICSTSTLASPSSRERTTGVASPAASSPTSNWW